MTTINESTSVIAVKTRQLTAGQSAIIYVSSTSDVGQIATVFDVQGFLSAPQSILISTKNGVDLGQGLSSIRIQQQFGYVTLRSESSTRWSVVGENAFRTPSSDYFIKGLEFSNLNASQMMIISSISTSRTITSSLTAMTGTLFGPLFVSSLNAAPQTFLVNNLSNSGNYFAQSSLSVSQSISILSTVSTVGPVTVQNNLSVGGPVAVRSTMYILSSLSTTQRILANSNLTVQGLVTTSSNLQCFAGANTSTTVAQQVSARIVVTNNILFDGAELRTGPNASLYVSSSLNVTNAIQTSTLTTNTISTPTITVRSTIFTPSLQIPNAAIRNAGGSVNISSIQANTIQYTTLYGSNTTSTVQSISTQTGLFSTLFINGGLYTSNMVIQTGDFDALYSQYILVDSIDSGGGAGLHLDTVSISTITISSSFLASQMSSFSSAALIRAAQVKTGAAQIGGAVTTSSLGGVVGMNATSSLTFSTPGIYTSSIAAIKISTIVGTTSSLTLSNAIVGPYLFSDPAAPYFVESTISGYSSNSPSEYVNGTGAPFSPFHVIASSDRTVDAYISSGPRLAYLTINYSYFTNAFSTNGTAAIILKNPVAQSTIALLSSTTVPGIQTYSLSNYPVNTNAISSIQTYSLFGPMTYVSSSVTQALVAGCSALTLGYSSDGGSRWVTLPYVGFETAAYGVAFGAGKWVAVGEGTTNTMILSYTGTAWYNLGMSVFSVRGNGIAWNGALWIATGEGTNTLASSYDGITWTGLGTAVFSVRGYGIAWNGTLWLATGEGTNTLATSTNGLVWTGQGTTVFSAAAYAAAWSGALWVAVGTGTNTLATSTNGLTWIGKGATVFDTSARAIAWNGANWVAGSDTQLYVPIAYSTDGLQWIRISCPLTAVYSIVWTGTQWVAGGVGTPYTTATSPTGLTWTASQPGLNNTTYAIASRIAPPQNITPSPLIVAAGTGTNFIVTSPNGTTWTPRTTPFTTAANCVAWNGTLWVAGGSGTYQIAYSYNGITWTGVSVSPITSISGISWGRGKWIAVGIGSAGNTRAESADGINWTPYAFTNGNFFQGVANGVVWAQGVWIAVGSPQGSGILFSLDGSNWVPQTTALFTTGRCITSNGMMFLAGGFGASIRMVSSLEGSVWTTVASCPFTTQVNQIAWGYGIWVAVGQGTHTLAYSYDGIAWIGLGTSIFSTAGLGVTWTGSLWVATGQGTNSLATSVDGISWNAQGTSLFSVGRGVAASPMFQPNTAFPQVESTAIRWDLSGVALLTQSIIEKPARKNPGYDSTAYSLDGYAANAFLQFSMNNTAGSVRIGLSVGGAAAPISYSFSFLDTGNFEIWESGYFVRAVGSYNNSDTFQIIFTGTKISYQKNSLELFSTPRNFGLPLFLGTQFNLGGTRLRNLEFHPLNQIVNSGTPLPNQFYTTTLARGFTTPPISFQRPIVETNFTPSLWQFEIPMSGTVVAPSSMLYAGVYISTNFLFSTSALQMSLTPVPSTYTLTYTLSTTVATNPGDILDVRIFTQHSQGVTSLYSTTLTNTVYNLSSVQFVELVHNTGGTGTQTSDLSLWIQNDTAPFGKYVNSNSGIEMNSGLMRWNGRQYGLAIQNQYNDLQTRNMTYTGGLYTASDSNLKHDIEYADTGSLYETMKGLPLHRYRLSDSYRDRFRTEDARQLGVLTTEVATRFPSMIHTVDSEFVPDLQTVDRVQFRYAHLGATQHIMGRLSTLRGKIAAL